MAANQIVQELDYPLGFQREAIRLISQAGVKTIRLHSSTLDAHVYDDEQLVDSVSRMLRAYAKAELRVLVSHADSIAGRRHRLIQLSKKLPSKCRIRELTMESDTFHEDFVIVDTHAGIYRRADQQQTAFMHENAPAALVSRIEHFDYLWERSSPSTALRDLAL